MTTRGNGTNTPPQSPARQTSSSKFFVVTGSLALLCAAFFVGTGLYGRYDEYMTTIEQGTFRLSDYVLSCPGAFLVIAAILFALGFVSSRDEKRGAQGGRIASAVPPERPRAEPPPPEFDGDDAEALATLLNAEERAILLGITDAQRWRLSALHQEMTKRYHLLAVGLFVPIIEIVAVPWAVVTWATIWSFYRRTDEVRAAMAVATRVPPRHRLLLKRRSVTARALLAISDDLRVFAAGSVLLAVLFVGLVALAVLSHPGAS